MVILAAVVALGVGLEPLGSVFRADGPPSTGAAGRAGRRRLVLGGLDDPGDQPVGAAGDLHVSPPGWRMPPNLLVRDAGVSMEVFVPGLGRGGQSPAGHSADPTGCAGEERKQGTAARQSAGAPGVTFPPCHLRSASDEGRSFRRGLFWRGRRSFASLRMTMGEASRMTFPLPVILRGAATKDLPWGPVGDGRRSFAVLRMTMGEGAQDDRGVVLRGTKSDARGDRARTHRMTKSRAAANAATAPFMGLNRARGAEDAKLSRAWRQQE